MGQREEAGEYNISDFTAQGSPIGPEVSYSVVLASPYWSQIAIWMPLEGSSIDFKNFENFTKIIIFSTGAACLGWAALGRAGQASSAG